MVCNDAYGDTARGLQALTMLQRASAHSECEVSIRTDSSCASVRRASPKGRGAGGEEGGETSAVTLCCLRACTCACTQLAHVVACAARYVYHACAVEARYGCGTVPGPRPPGLKAQTLGAEQQGGSGGVKGPAGRCPRGACIWAARGASAV